MQSHIDNKRLGQKVYVNNKICTDVRLIKDCSDFFQAHEEHQNYLELNPKGYCNHKIRFKEWPKSEDSHELTNIA